MMAMIGSHDDRRPFFWGKKISSAPHYSNPCGAATIQRTYIAHCMSSQPDEGPMVPRKLVTCLSLGCWQIKTLFPSPPSSKPGWILLNSALHCLLPCGAWLRSPQEELDQLQQVGGRRVNYNPSRSCSALGSLALENF